MAIAVDHAEAVNSVDAIAGAGWRLAVGRLPDAADAVWPLTIPYMC
jgi:hypothetical protein